jgi:methionyl-tRNA formyltransferase
MRLIFAGTPEFAATALVALHTVGHTIALVLTQADRPAGRGMKLHASAVKQTAQRLGLPLAQPENLKTAAIQDTLRAADAELMVVAAYGLILPQAVLAIPPRGCINIHASLLPRWRGAAPIQRAILEGDSDTGITIMQMDAGLDTGAMLLQKTLPITPTDNAGSLHDKLAQLGAVSVVEAISRLETLIPEAQDNTCASYATKLCKTEAELDWTRPAAELARSIRAYNPVPGARTVFNAQTFKIWQAMLETGYEGQPGEVLESDEHGIVVACGEQALRLLELQSAGGKRLSVAAFITGHAVRRGRFFGE